MSERQAPDVTVGTIVAPHGIAGEVKVRIETDFPERFIDLREIWLEPRNGSGYLAQVESSRFHQDAALIKFAGCNDRTMAEGLRGAELRIERSELKKLGPDQFYLDDIIGIDVFTVDGDHIGEVTEILRAGGNDVYVTEKAMIPAVKQFVLKVDIAKRKMVVNPIPGLLEG